MLYKQLSPEGQDGKGLCNLDFVDRYADILQANLPNKFSDFDRFFSGTQRLETLAAILKRHIQEDGLTVLNVGSGPFATELFVERLQKQQVQSIDYTPEFAPFYQLLLNEGYIANTSFEQVDVMEVEFPQKAFDLIIIHDVLFEKALEMETLITRLSPFLKPGGYLYFDFINSRTQWVKRLFGRHDQFRYYDPVKVKGFVTHAGFEILSFEATRKAHSWPIRVLHHALQILSRGSGNYSVLVQSKSRP
ncbi:class I SAM-dependent methyltransferase [Sneathiella sp.]|jgi:SAM-dependent methyltransferase|uniref:class I SAM-dependent methyltransferase n=1 Tax=Sneathiella sp. TaxID=1964365 RepID=UPI0039E4A7C4